MKLSQFIREYMDEILEDWKIFAASIPGNEELSEQELVDHARHLLESVVERMEGPKKPEGEPPRSEEEAERKGVLDGPGHAHAEERLSQGFTLYQLMAEFNALRATVTKAWGNSEYAQAHDAVRELCKFNDGVDRVLMNSVFGYADEIDRSRQLFLGVLGHDLRNPLNAMMMCATLIKRESEATTRQVRCANTILHSGERIERILSDLLDLARKRLGGHLPLNLTQVDLGGICQDVVTELQLANPQVDFSYDIDGDVRGCWDESRLNQVLWNLGGNAVKHGDPQGEVGVMVRELPDQQTVRVEVSNRGNPIPDSAKRAIFDPLTALKSQDETRVTHSGIGLGLYICKIIVDAHDGEIEVVSSEQDGTRFCVTLPKRSEPKQALKK
jgi:signal transduction histidine kinase